MRSRTQDLPITISDSLPLSCRIFVGAKAIKLGSWGKHPDKYIILIYSPGLTYSITLFPTTFYIWRVISFFRVV